MKYQKFAEERKKTKEKEETTTNLKSGNVQINNNPGRKRKSRGVVSTETILPGEVVPDVLAGGYDFYFSSHIHVTDTANLEKLMETQFNSSDNTPMYILLFSRGRNSNY